MERRATKPMPTQPLMPMASGASSHSPLPIERPSAIKLGPTTSVTVSLAPIRGAPKTASGVGKSSTLSGGPAPSSYPPARAVGGMTRVPGSTYSAMSLLPWGFQRKAFTPQTRDVNQISSDFSQEGLAKLSAEPQDSAGSPRGCV